MNPASPSEVSSSNPRALRAGVAGVVVLFALLGVLAHYQFERLSDSAQSVVVTYDAIDSVSDLMVGLNEAETGQRGYLLTGNAEYLRPYEAARLFLPDRLDRFQREMHGRLAPGEVIELRRRIEEKLEELAASLRLNESGRSQDALALINSNSGHSLMESLREVLTRVREGERRTLQKQRENQEGARFLGRSAIAFGVVFAILVVLLLGRAASRAQNKLLVTMRIVETQEGYLRAMMASSSAPVFLVDASGHVHFVNPAGAGFVDEAPERLLGRWLADFVVFRDSRAPFHELDIVDRVLAEQVRLHEVRVTAETNRGSYVVGLEAMPVSGENGQRFGVMVVVRNFMEGHAASALLHHQDRLRSLEAALGVAVTEPGSVATLLRRVAIAVHEHLDAALTRFWIVEGEGALLALSTSVGSDRGLTESDSRFRLGEGELGRLASGRTLFVTNDPLGHPHVPHQKWMADEGMKAFVGCPLLVGSELLGLFVLALREPIHPAVEADLPRLCRQIAIGLDRRRQEEEVRRAGVEKDRFLATLSHELRGPLSPLKASASELENAVRDGSVDVKRVGRWVGIARRQTLQLERLVEDLLDVNRISRGKLSVRQGEVELGVVIDQAIEAVLPLVSERKQRLSYRKADEQLRVLGDAARLIQVVYNLLSNAARYSQDGDEISLTVERVEASAVIEVIDHGIGIAPQNLGNIFRMFEQIEPESASSREGFGIGLALVEHLVALHGGLVGVKSEGLGRGSAFWVSFPLLEADSTSPIEGKASPRSSSDDSAFAGEEAGKEVASSDARARTLRALVVDDDVDSAESVGLALEAVGVEVRLAHDGLEALTALEEFAPGFIVVDLGLPKMSGLELARRIRDTARGKSARLVALTGRADEAARDESLAAGFDAHLAKPVDLAALRDQWERAASADEA